MSDRQFEQCPARSSGIIKNIKNKTMSDRLSPENLGKDMFLAYAIEIDEIPEKTAIYQWNHEFPEHEKQDWIAAARRFCKSLKEAQADS